MASEAERPASDDDTVLVENNGQPTSEDITHGGDEWPVSDLYYVGPDGEAASEAAEEETTPRTTGATREVPARRRFPPDVGLGAALAGLGVLAALLIGAVLLGLGDDDPNTAQAPTGPSTTASTSAETTTAPPPAGQVGIENVEGLSLAEAREALEAQGLEVRARRLASDRPRGEVLRQEPPAGADVTKGTVVALFVSQGSSESGETAADMSVPGVLGRSVSDAVAAIREAGLEARVSRVTSPQRPGTVVDQSPAAGTSVEEGTAVRLEVAKRGAPAVQRFEVPDVVGSTASAARSELRAAGLTVRNVGVVSQEPAGTVISQSPPAGAEVRKGTRVRLTVSTGPAKVAVPDVTGLDEASARQELERAGFQVRVTDESVTDLAQDGLVLRQTPAGGSNAEDGAVVTIVVGRAG